jgi:hypothetical protein
MEKGMVLKTMIAYLFFPLLFMFTSCKGNIENFLNVQKKIIKEINVARVWSAQCILFDICTTDKFQYVAFYDSSRNMCIAQRLLVNEEWEITRLPSITKGWDNHNYIKIARDRDGYLHVSGNMHNVPLIYFRSNSPDNISSFEKLTMIGQNETSVTYPIFFNDSEGKMFFQFRDGSSGNGVTYWNRYFEKTKQWIRVFDQGLFDGEGEVNAYPSNPTLGPDGYFHIVWMWRANLIANTNHNLSYMQSKNLSQWETVRGKSLTLPIKWSNSEVYVDPVGPWNGLINMDFNLCWDNHNRLCITYHKYDQEGVSQAFVACWESDKWKIYQISKWEDYRWDLNKGGALLPEIIAPKLKPIGKDKLIGEYYHKKYGKGLWIISEKNFQIIKELPNRNISTLPATLIDSKPENDGMIINRILDNTGNYILQWETLPVNQDRPRNPPYPNPTLLKVIELSKN